MDNFIRNKIVPFTNKLLSVPYSIEQILVMCHLAAPGAKHYTYTDVSAFMSLSQSDVRKLTNPLLGGLLKKALIIESKSDGVLYLQASAGAKNIYNELVSLLPLHYSDVTEVKIKVEAGLKRLNAELTKECYEYLSKSIHENFNAEKLLELGLIESNTEHQQRRVGSSLSFIQKNVSHEIEQPRYFQEINEPSQLAEVLFAIIEAKTPEEALDILIDKIGERLSLERDSHDYMTKVCELETKYKVSFYRLYLDQGANAVFAESAIHLLENLFKKLELFVEE